jgi:L-alanine-DL-glutamate epimerase-like enolase superfamily enzyme
VSTYARVAELPLRVEGYGLETLSLQLAPEFVRLTTVVTLQGAGEEGAGEDVCYDPPEHESQAAAGPVLPLAGEFTLDGFSRHLDGLDLFHAGPPARPASIQYRRWAFESAALDLALRQAGTSLADALGVAPRPVSFVVSTRLDPPFSPDGVARRLARSPGLRFKLDPTDEWTPELMAELARLGVVDTLDMKGCYDEVPFGVPTDPETYRAVVTHFPDAWIEDPKLTPPLREVLRGHEDRFTWDAPIHSVRDVLDLERTPRMINVKPSRFGRLGELLATYDHLRDAGIGAYGGGQTELGPGRGQIQYLASLFHPGAPNDTAPSGYNDPSRSDGLPDSPLPVAAAPTGFRWGDG